MWTGSLGVKPDARQPNGSRSRLGGHIAKRTEIGSSSSRYMSLKSTVCYQQREWQAAHFRGKRHYVRCIFWGYGIRTAIALFLTSDEETILSKLLALHNEWATGVSGNPKNFGVKIKSHVKTQSHIDASITFG